MIPESAYPRLGMTSEEFRRRGKELIDYIADYYDNLNLFKPLSEVEPDYLRKLLPTSAPEEPESFETIKKDIEEKIVPGVTHWQSGKFFAYYPATSSYPGILGEMYSAMFNGIGFSWINGPAMTELETITLDWLGKLIGLDSSFLSYHEDGTSLIGGGVIQGSASEATIVAMLAGKKKAIDTFKGESPNHTEDELLAFTTRLVAYASNHTHSSGEKAAMILNIRFKEIITGEDGVLNKKILENAIQNDLELGLVPFFVLGSFGTTAIGATDDFIGISEAAKNHNLWLHIDAAYAGAALICPEFQPLAPGLNLADSLSFNPYKWMLVNFDCSAMWFKNSYYIKSALSIHRDYYKNSATDSGLVRDYKDWQMPLSRRFRSLKLFLVMRTYGANGLRAHIRRTVNYAGWLETELLKDGRFTILLPRFLSLLVFQIDIGYIQSVSKLQMGSKKLTEIAKKANSTFAQHILKDKTVFLTTVMIKGSTAIRVAVGTPSTDEKCMGELLSTLRSCAESAINEAIR